MTPAVAVTSPRRLWRHGVIGTMWLVGCFAATYLAMAYDYTPGRVGQRLTLWPTETESSSPAALIHHPDQTTVLAFLHPRCVCTRATVQQLVRTLAAHPGAVAIASVFVPLDVSDQPAWEESDYVKTIRTEVPGARMVFDRGGVQAQRFGAFTSGTILVYDRQGREIFRGGITDRRGGERENPGLQQLALTLTEGRGPQAEPTPVFGCPITASDDELWQGPGATP
ncbi:MAG: hypothetical protein HY597_03040 [Candidatus Omnitrophica bacterium]|nr:hypothetical protein [Candidatus Omnitrophota bacterium]